MFSRKEFDKLYQYAISLTNNNDEAFDFVHDALMQIQNRKLNSPLSYIKTVIRHNFFSHYKQKRKEEYSDLDSVEIASLHDLEGLIIQKNSVQELLKHIQPEERELLYLWAVEGKTIQEISLEKEIKLGTLLSKMSRIKKKIISMESTHGLY